MSQQILQSLKMAYKLVNTIDPLPEGDCDEIELFHNNLKQMHQRVLPNENSPH